MILFIIKSGDVFATHTYYVMFCIPFLSIFIGYFIDEFPLKSTLLKILSRIPKYIKMEMMENETTLSFYQLYHLDN